jgi:serine-threonine kinase receptor-associated protein
VRVYDLDTGAEKEVYKGHHGPVLCASYSPDGEVYASGSEDGELSTHQSSRQSRQWKFNACEGDDFIGTALMPRIGTIRLWQTNPGKSYGLWQTNE